MTAYLIVYGLDSTDRLAAYRFATRTEAQLASRRLVPAVPVDGYGRYDPSREVRPGTGGCAYVVEREEDVPFSGTQLTSIYNGLTGESVGCFESRAAGIRRLLSKLPAVTADGQPNEEAMPEVDTQTETNGQIVTDGRQRRGRVSRFRSDQQIEVLVRDNPKKMGKKNHDRFAALMALGPTTTVEAALAAGVTTGDLIYDAERGFIRIND